MRRGIFIGSRANHNNSPTVTTVRLSDLPLVFRLAAAGRQREGGAARALAHQHLPTEDVQVVAYHGRPGSEIGCTRFLAGTGRVDRCRPCGAAHG